MEIEAILEATKPSLNFPAASELATDGTWLHWLVSVAKEPPTNFSKWEHTNLSSNSLEEIKEALTSGSVLKFKNPSVVPVEFTEKALTTLMGRPSKVYNVLGGRYDFVSHHSISNNSHADVRERGRTYTKAGYRLLDVGELSDREEDRNEEGSTEEPHECDSSHCGCETAEECTTMALEDVMAMAIRPDQTLQATADGALTQPLAGLLWCLANQTCVAESDRDLDQMTMRCHHTINSQGLFTHILRTGGGLACSRRLESGKEFVVWSEIGPDLNDLDAKSIHKASFEGQWKQAFHVAPKVWHATILVPGDVIVIPPGTLYGTYSIKPTIISIFEWLMTETLPLTEISRRLDCLNPNFSDGPRPGIFSDIVDMARSYAKSQDVARSSDSILRSLTRMVFQPELYGEAHGLDECMPLVPASNAAALDDSVLTISSLPTTHAALQDEKVLLEKKLDWCRLAQARLNLLGRSQVSVPPTTPWSNLTALITLDRLYDWDEDEDDAQDEDEDADKQAATESGIEPRTGLRVENHEPNLKRCWVYKKGNVPVDPTIISGLLALPPGSQRRVIGNLQIKLVEQVNPPLPIKRSSGLAVDIKRPLKKSRVGG
ncbi:hypothetical protein BD410DRAFT_847034 [Rickenella mellea]|uniref:JmjC domain-containing protein n=1 Tax=Rickenella mellea TaxID=50990 RepID=A0A4Y7PDP8_9AGAM|nr:hypothetical protein BD410DRAFT_847034 [Rickenella mellea]